ncbi:hypothetical protein [Nitrosopumilus sp.]|uniref:hypothetical protein n=1 Tax=Nitrosopumilus sp. TaxID=2024843 RepID=UPI003B5CA9FA
MTFCSGMCARFKAKKPAARDMSKNEDSQKYCLYCEVFVKAEGLRCPCFNKQLKTRSSSKVTREAMFSRI